MRKKKYTMSKTIFWDIGNVRVLSSDGNDDIYSSADIAKLMGRAKSRDIIDATIDEQYVVHVAYDEVNNISKEFYFNSRGELFIKQPGILQVFSKR